MSRVTILVVEDEPLLRLLATEILQDAGFTVIAASTGKDALSLLATDPTITMLVTDVHIPGVPDGLNLAHIAGHRYPHVATVIMSGKAMPRSTELPNGAVFLPKPYRPQELLDTIERLLSKREHRNAGSSFGIGRTL